MTTSQISSETTNAIKEFVEEYNAELRDLTFNSKPIINNLTIIAGENIHASGVIIKLIENRLREVSSNKKLPLLYLIDSIVKNIGGVYHRGFARNIVDTFTGIYSNVGESTRRSMLKLLSTWFSSSVFTNQTGLIQSWINKNRQPTGSSRTNRRTQRYPTSAPAPTGRSTRHAPTGRTARHPQSSTSGKSMGRIAQILQMTNTSSTPGLYDIPNTRQVHTDQNQYSHPHHIPRRPAPVPHVNSTPHNTGTVPPKRTEHLLALRDRLNVLNGNAPRQSTHPPSSNYPLAVPMNNNPPPNYPMNPSRPMAIQNTMNPMYSTGNHGYNPHPPAPVDPLSLIKDLTQRGLISSTPFVAPPKIIPPPVDPPMSLHGSRRSLGLGIARLVKSLYNGIPLQCSTCGLRFSDDAKLKTHMDWHFSMNRKEKEKAKKAISRMWFGTEAEWVADTTVDAVVATPFFNTGTNTEPDSTPAKNVIHTVVMDEKNPNCSLCKERFEHYWDSDAEEWMYKHAIKLPTGEIVHYDCFTTNPPSGTNATSSAGTITTITSSSVHPLAIPSSLELTDLASAAPTSMTMKVDTRQLGDANTAANNTIQNGKVLSDVNEVLHSADGSAHGVKRESEDVENAGPAPKKLKV